MRVLITIYFLLTGAYIFSQSPITVKYRPIVSPLKDCNISTTPIRFHCGATITRSGEPLLVIDGVPYEMKELKQLDTNDIESINILKESLASSLYGYRAANGVIIITTKSSKLRFFVIKDFLDDSNISGATMTFISKNRRDTMMFVANDSGIVRTDKLDAGQEYEVKVSSIGYKSLSATIWNKSQKLFLERNIIKCPEVVIIDYPLITCRRITYEYTKITSCGYLITKDTLTDDWKSKQHNMFKIFPNPLSKGSFITINLITKNNDPLEVKVIGVNGSLLSSQAVNASKGNNQFKIQTDSRWSAGVYFVQLADKSGTLIKSQKLIIQ